ncbi:hypothetical protein SDC9_115346 [bioreactor metagenome]|uniref:Uncharacterized protein n=1 Tax=bioreactor metagenome TaxID=1076179 RepID=A0A645C372_9ZZZZ
MFIYQSFIGIKVISRYNNVKYKFVIWKELNELPIELDIFTNN